MAKNTMTPPSLKRIDFEKGWFEAGGKTYYIQTSLSFNRYKKFIQFHHQLAFGADVSAHLKFVEFVLSTLSGPLTGMNIHRIYENAMNVQNAYKNFIAKDMQPVFEFLSLFINYAGEDISQWDERLAQEKINDWKDYDVNDFSLLLSMLLPDLRQKYQPSFDGDPEEKRRENSDQKDDIA